MPILDIELVCRTEGEFSRFSARTFADAVAAVWRAAPGRVWVRLRFLPLACYAENHTGTDDGALPVFVAIVHAQPPTGAALESEVVALTAAVALAASRPKEQVHLLYEAPATGRVAFGGTLVRPDRGAEPGTVDA